MGKREFPNWPTLPGDNAIEILSRTRPFEPVKATEDVSTKVANLRRFFNSTDDLRVVVAGVARLKHR